MLKSIKWSEDAVLVIKVDDVTYTLAQMRKNGLMEFFDVFRSNDSWEDVDLNECKLLFCIFVAEKRIKNIFVRILNDNEVIKNSRPIIKEMLSFEWVSENVYTSNLIELSDSYSSVGGRVIKTALSDKTDIETINTHEFCGVFGDSKKLLDRLKFFKDTGINWDEQKKFIYPSIERPTGFPVD
ncbi:hypothetical protein YA0079_23195 [Pseudomonas syringae]|uniref:hypothetical protein n=1 Tax=Pseudomonas syringae TaxID=317 RepID=UPI000F00D3C7|nr:hypothetical protein [Pseudomonas syringae]MBI6748123.1 hypothetical protein [Pseudomonas syringae]